MSQDSVVLHKTDLNKNFQQIQLLQLVAFNLFKKLQMNTKCVIGTISL